MQSVFVLQLLGGRVAICASLSSAIEQGPVVIATTWREASPGRWLPNVTKFNRFAGYEIVQEELHGKPEPVVEPPRKPLSEVRVGMRIGRVESVELPHGYTIDILAGERGERVYQATEGTWVSCLFGDAEQAVRAAAAHARIAQEAA